MKKILLSVVLLASCIIIAGQDLFSLHESNDNFLLPNTAKLLQEEGYPMARFAVSVNPLGFLEMGPVINAEVGLIKGLVLNTHVRFAPAGLLTYVVTDWPDKITGLAYGGGLIYFFGEKRNKPYIGFISEYQKNTDIWDENETYEEREVDKVFVLMVNGGYRFRFNSGFFINTGAFLGFGRSNWVSTESSITDSGTEVVPAGLLEVTLGLEF